MHEIQEKLLKIISEKNIGDLTLRDIGKLINERLPQKVKHHLSQLERKGFILIDKKKKYISRISHKIDTNNIFVSIPIIGTANCGPATIYADQNVEGHLKISKRLVPSKKNVFAIKADGNSMNKANINNKNIVSGDYVIIDSSNRSPKNNDYVLSIIDGMANIKKYKLDKENDRIVLSSESTQDYQPIFIHKDDDFLINGKVISVIKK